MDFFERQEQSKRSTVVLVILFLLCTLCICIAVSYPICLYVLGKLHKLESFHPVYVFTHIPPSILLLLFFCILAYIAYESNQKIKELSKGGGEYIVRSLHGRLVSRHSAGLKEGALLNVVEEMAIASGIPPPPVYILDTDLTVNAFAAGFTSDDAVIGVTAGAAEHLTREELQGVIAHEFSHIFNGDMRLNIFTVGILNGISALGRAGKKIIKSKSGLLGAALYVIGSAGLFFGNLIKAAINREREFLADSTAAQFTRHPKALADALKKIGGLGSFLSSESSDEFSHFYFASGIRSTLFNTHPSIDKRIYALDPRWDGIYILTEPSKAVINAQAEHAKTILEKKERNREKAEKMVTATIFSGTPGKLDNAAEIIKKIPRLLYVGAAYIPDAQFIIFVLLLECDGKISEIQKELIAKAYFEESAESAEKFETILSEVQKYPRDLYLNLVYICIPTLKILSKEEYLKFKETLIRLIEADDRVSWGELNLKYLILYPLDIAFGIRKPARETCLYIGAMKRDAEVLLSKFIHYQFNDDELARSAFNKTAASFGVGALKYLPSQNISIADLENAYNAAQTAKLPLKKKLFEMAAVCLKTDGELSAHDVETLHALSSLLHLPPPERLGVQNYSKIRIRYGFF